MVLKKYLLQTSLGHLGLEARDKLTLLKFALTNPEAVGTLSNDILSTKLITNICAPGKVFIDIGAHIGSIISEVQRSDNSIHIVAIEAIPEKVINLKKQFPQVRFFECALGEENATVSFYVNERESGYSSLLSPEDAKNSIVREITVQLRKLDEVEEFENVDAIKIDVEGAELGVIKGATETIKRNMPIIMFESAPGETKTKEEIWRVFDSLGYGIHLPNRLAHNDKAFSEDCFMDSHIYPRYTTNYFAIPFERRIEVRDRARKIVGTDI